MQRGAEPSSAGATRTASRALFEREDQGAAGPHIARSQLLRHLPLDRPARTGRGIGPAASVRPGLSCARARAYAGSQEQLEETHNGPRLASDEPPAGACRPTRISRSRTSTLPPLGDGMVRVRNHWLSVDPYMRGRMNDVKSYVPPFQIDAADGRRRGRRGRREPRRLLRRRHGAAHGRLARRGGARRAAAQQAARRSASSRRRSSAISA